MNKQIMTNYFHIPVDKIKLLANASDSPENFDLAKIAMASVIGVSRTDLEFSGSFNTDLVFESDIHGTDYRVVTIYSKFAHPHNVIIELSHVFAGDDMTAEQAEIIAEHCFVMSEEPQPLLLTSMNYIATIHSESDEAQLLRNASANHDFLVSEGLLTKNSSSDVKILAKNHNLLTLPGDLPNRFLVLCSSLSAEVSRQYFIRDLSPEMSSSEFILAAEDDCVLAFEMGGEDYRVLKNDVLGVRHNPDSGEWVVADMVFRFFNVTPVF